MKRTRRLTTILFVGKLIAMQAFSFIATTLHHHWHAHSGLR